MDDILHHIVIKLDLSRRELAHRSPNDNNTPSNGQSHVVCYLTRKGVIASPPYKSIVERSYIVCKTTEVHNTASSCQLRCCGCHRHCYSRDRARMKKMNWFIINAVFFASMYPNFFPWYTWSHAVVCRHPPWGVTSGKLRSPPSGSPTRSRVKR